MTDLAWIEGPVVLRDGVVDIPLATCDWPQARARFDPEPTDPTDSER